MSALFIATMVGAFMIGFGVEAFGPVRTRHRTALVLALGGLWGALCWVVLG